MFSKVVIYMRRYIKEETGFNYVMSLLVVLYAIQAVYQFMSLSKLR